MPVRPLLGLLLGVLLTAGCAGSSSSEDGAADDSALRALKAGDVDVEVLGSTSALAAPAKFAEVRSWSIHYVEMTDPTPENNYKGLMLNALDAYGQPLYLLPFGYAGADALATDPATATAPPVMFVYNAAPDENGDLTPVTFAVGKTVSASVIEDEKASLDWIASEQQRLLAMLQSRSQPQQASGQSLHVQTLPWEKLAFCGLHLASFFLGSNPLLYFVVDGGLDIAEGLIDKSGKKVTTGALKAGIGGVGKAVLATASKDVGAKLAKGGKALGIVAVGASAAYNMYDKGSVTGGLLETAKDLIPQDCRDSYAAITKK